MAGGIRGGGMCMVGGMHDRGVWMVGGGHAWQGACMVGGTHGRRYGHCSRRYVIYLECILVKELFEPGINFLIMGFETLRFSS